MPNTATNPTPGNDGDTTKARGKIARFPSPGVPAGRADSYPKKPTWAPNGEKVDDFSRKAPGRGSAINGMA